MSLASLWTSGTARSPYPGHLALATRTLDQARDHLSRIFADHRLAPEGRARAVDFRHYFAPLGEMSFNGLQYGAAVTVSAPALTDFYLMQFTLRGACDITCGSHSVSLQPRSILVMNPTRPYAKRWSADCRQLIVRIDADLLHRQLGRLLGRAPDRPLEFALAAVDGIGSGATMARFAELICRDFDGEGLMARQAVQKSAAETLCNLLLATFDHSYRAALDRPAEPPAPRFVRRAEDYIRAHLGSDLTPDDIAKAAGASTRSLQRGFRSFRDTTPMAALKSARLSAARAALLNRGASVTEAAIACGLTHLGKFARDYRRAFGELPSRTVRRRR